MKRLGRLLFNVVTLLTLLLCVATLSLCVRSHWRADALRYGRIHDPAAHETFYMIVSTDWVLTIARLEVRLQGDIPPWFRIDRDADRTLPPGFSVRTFAQDRDQPKALGEYFRFVIDRDHNVWSSSSFSGPPGRWFDSPATLSDRSATILCPLWIVPLAFALLPLTRFLASIWRRRRERRVLSLGLCSACTYDLTGNVSGVCPECGTAVARGDA